jgi:hypothetical protein
MDLGPHSGPCSGLIGITHASPGLLRALDGHIHLLAEADGVRIELDLQPGEVLLGREPIPLAGGRLWVLAADNRARAPLWPAPPPHCHGEGPTDDGEGISVREPTAKGSGW